jgi:hypothetical protein
MSSIKDSEFIPVTTPHGSRAVGFWNDAAVSSHGTRSVHAHQQAVAQSN